ncbi:MAG: IPExxxVDY family protein [Bacteroidia bacterium]|nr:IPExxxVDY family protein [Bacteroidia bacterium]
MGKHTLKIEYDYDFKLIGISSHEKDYRICWALNNILELDLTKSDPLEIKSKKQNTPSFFSLFSFEDADEFMEYFVISNFSENKLFDSKSNTLFGKSATESQSTEIGILIPEQKQMNYFFVIRGEITKKDIKEMIRKIKTLDFILTAVLVDVADLKSKVNLIF